MANEQNLIPKDSNQDREEAKKNGRKGGIASGKARRRKKALAETMTELLSMPLKSDDLADIEKIQSLAAVKGQNITVQEAIVIAQVQKALKGNQGAARLLFEYMGEQLTNNAAQTENHSALIEAIKARNNED